MLCSKALASVIIPGAKAFFIHTSSTNIYNYQRGPRKAPFFPHRLSTRLRQIYITLASSLKIQPNNFYFKASYSALICVSVNKPVHIFNSSIEDGQFSLAISKLFIFSSAFNFTYCLAAIFLPSR